MGAVNWANYSFLIVDDVRLCRINVKGILSSFGAAKILEAANGAEALSVLEDPAQQVDCVFSDFKMPVMNGLELLRAIRMGVKNTRRDLPVIMLTGYGDESLVGLALALDVSTFLLKPASKESLSGRLQSLLSEDQSSDRWTRPPEAYESVDINASVANLLADEDASSDQEPEPQLPQSGGEAIACSLRDIPENAVLAQDIRSVNGRQLYEAGTVLTSRHITRLKGLKDLGFLDAELMILPGQASNAAGPAAAPASSATPTAGAVPRESHHPVETRPPIDPTASSSTEGGLQRSTFARYGKLNFGATANCSRCRITFSPSNDLVRQHNRGVLTSLLCPKCNERDTKLLCGCVSIMVVKGGFPMMAQQLVQDFHMKDASLPKDESDPFESLRQEYHNDPLTEIDVMYWVHANYFTMNPSTMQLECMIDRIMGDPERVRLLGKAGLKARQMAARRALRQKGMKQQ